MSNYKKISIFLFLLFLVSFNNLNARTVCNYKVTTITENNVIKGHQEVKNCEEKIEKNSSRFLDSFDHLIAKLLRVPA